MRITYSGHARIRMRERGITECQVRTVLTTQPGNKPGTTAYIATVEGRTLKIVATNPDHYVITSFWRTG
jgi:hypothetical protein